jgi:thiol-disulfide isomerase/thioredoxin
VAQEFGGGVRFVEENYGDSELGRRFGVRRYPALFVDDVLMATPKDFGFYGKGEGRGDGRYTPWRSAASHARFQADLRKVIQLVLAGKKADARAAAPPSPAAEIARLPAITLQGLGGETLAPRDLAGRVVVLEVWATWCPPCRGTLSWLGKLQQRHGAALRTVAVAVQSDEDDVRAAMRSVTAPLVWTMATPELARALGDVTTVPTLFVFDRDGRTKLVRYGAPPELHGEVEREIERLLAETPSR